MVNLLKNGVSLFLLLLFLSDCSTYMNHRRKDIQDIFTFGFEKPGYGVGLRMSYLAFGVVFQGGETIPGKKDLGSGIGLRGGDLGKYHSQQLIFGFLGGESFFSGEAIIDEEGNFIEDEGILQTSSERSNTKSFKVRYLKFFSDPPKERQKRNRDTVKELIAKQLLEKTKDPSLLAYIPPKPKKPNGYPVQYHYQIEAYLGVYYGVRIGVNFAEILDFFLGITTIDILKDDLKN
jgi:hypothetical protein